MSANTIPERGENGEPIMRSAGIPVDDNHRVRHKGIMDDTILAGQAKDIDWKIDQLQYNQQDIPAVFIGVDVLLEGGNWGDWVHFCVGDIDGVGVALGLYDQPTFDFLKAQNGGFVPLDQFGDTYYLKPNDRTTMREYKADLIPGLYIRAHYQNTGSNDAKMRINILRYGVTA